MVREVFFHASKTLEKRAGAVNIGAEDLNLTFLVESPAITYAVETCNGLEKLDR